MKEIKMNSLALLLDWEVPKIIDKGQRKER